MVMGCAYGSHRTLEPKGGLPQTAWKLNTDLPIYDNELLIDARILHLNFASFSQMLNEIGGNSERIAERVSSITRMRGKLHNPITGSGGMLLGKVKQIGKNHPSSGFLKINDNIATMVCLTLTPLKINKIHNVILSAGQIDIEGYAILFESGIYTKVPNNIHPRVILTVLSVAGAVIQSYNIAKPGDNIAIIGADGKTGLLSMYAVRDKIGLCGRIIAIVRTEQGAERIRALEVADEIVIADTTNLFNSLGKVKKIATSDSIDLTIDCIEDCYDTLGQEMFSIMITREHGKVFFASPATRYNAASLGAEGIGKDLDLLFYKGYAVGHSDYAIKLLRENPKLQSYLEKRLLENSSRAKFIKSTHNYQTTDIDLAQLTNMSLGDVVIHSPTLQNTVKTALRIAPYDTTVLVTGESGAGKEIIVKIIHQASKRKSKPYLKINCAAIPESLIEAELFGYEGGTFTGALKEGKQGIFEAANGGTLFLDEIGEMSMAIQAKLLRAIQEKEIIRVGGTKSVPVDVRIVSATNRDLRKLVEQGKFREDLYYRINVVNLRVPALRERKEAIPALVDHFLNKYNNLYNMEKFISPQGMRVLFEYAWPGNIRELDNLIQKVILCQEQNIITDVDILNYIFVDKDEKKADKTLPETDKDFDTLESAIIQTEKEMFEKAVKEYRTTREIAAALNVSQSTVVRRLKKYNLR